MNTLTFDLVTPEATFFSGAATLVEAPGTLGDFGVLPGHMDFISTLRPGVVQVHSEDGAVTRVFVDSGLAEVNATSCTILAERATNLSQLTRADAELRMARAKEALENAFEDYAIMAAQREIEIADAIIVALSADA